MPQRRFVKYTFLKVDPAWRRLDDERRALLARLQQSLPEFVATLINHRPEALRGRSLREAMNVEQRTPGRLAKLFGAWNKAPHQMYRAPPSLVFAVLGQARADGSMSPEDESELLAKLLSFWAMRSTLDTAAYCAAIPKSRVQALAA